MQVNPQQSPCCSVTWRRLSMEKKIYWRCGSKLLSHCCVSLISSHKTLCVEINEGLLIIKQFSHRTMVNPQCFPFTIQKYNEDSNEYMVTGDLYLHKSFIFKRRSWEVQTHALEPYTSPYAIIIIYLPSQKPKFPCTQKNIYSRNLQTSVFIL